MKIPTEEQIDQIISELKMSSDLNHLHGNKENGECDVCHFAKEIEKRGNDKGGPTALDQMVISILQQNGPTGMTITIIPGGLDACLEISRMCFLMGMKFGEGSNSVDELEKMVGL